MTLSLFFVGLLPILLFVILDIYATPRVAIAMSVVTAIAIGGFYFFALDEWDHSITAEIVLFLIFGAIGLKMDNSRLFKFQPVVLGLATAGFLWWQFVVYGPYFLKAAALMTKLAPEYQERLANPKIQAMMTYFSWHSAIALALHALVLAWFALRKGTVAWGLWRAAIWPILIVVMVIDGAIV